MKLKIDANGNAVLVDGKPVYIYDNGQEVPFDAPAAMAKINELNREQAERRKTNEKLVGILNEYKVGEEEGQPVYLNPEDAKKAVNTVKNLSNKELLDAGEVEKLKQNMQAAYLEKEEGLKKGFKAEKDALAGEITKRDQAIFKLMVKSQFANSPTIRDKTILPPDMAAEYFGKNFRVEGEGEDVHVVGYLDGEKILSKEKPGYIAPFEEALTVVLDSYPMKNQIFKTSGGGAGSAGNQGGTGGGQDGKHSFDRDAFMKLPPSERLSLIHQGKVPASGSGS